MHYSLSHCFTHLLTTFRLFIPIHVFAYCFVSVYLRLSAYTSPLYYIPSPIFLYFISSSCLLIQTYTHLFSSAIRTFLLPVSRSLIYLLHLHRSSVPHSSWLFIGQLSHLHYPSLSHPLYCFTQSPFVSLVPFFKATKFFHPQIRYHVSHYYLSSLSLLNYCIT